MTIQAVIFDMGGTIETLGYTRELRLNATTGIQKYLKGADINLGLSDEALYEVVSNGLKRYHDFRLQSLVEYSPQKVWREFILKDFSFNPAKLDEIAEDLMTYIETHYYQREMRPEVPEVLKAIQQSGLKIGLISNVISRGQVPFNLAKYKIEKYFNPIILSSECGIRKPDPAIFHYAARLMNVPTSACVYVGDRIARDIIGAQKAGFRLAIQIQHDFDHGENDEGAIPDAIISNMTELLDILQVEIASPEKVPPSQIRALLFDAGDILYYRPKTEEKFSGFLKELGIDTAKDHLAEKAALSRQAFRGQIEQDEFYEAYLHIFGVDDPDQIQCGKEILKEENLDVRFFEGVQKTLITLKNQGYLLGIITDTANSVHTKLSWFERGGFGHVWDSITSSKEVGFQKPEPEIYYAALKQLGLSSNQVVFVGHRISELDGARAVGIKTIAFNYDEGANADYFINKFADLLEIPLVPINKNEVINSAEE
jgi:HAD superfamily hydrolase (TIGR01549 family)/HAD superfamily hydrolase (TIGR01509 family)